MITNATVLSCTFRDFVIILWMFTLFEPGAGALAASKISALASFIYTCHAVLDQQGQLKRTHVALEDISRLNWRSRDVVSVPLNRTAARLAWALTQARTITQPHAERLQGSAVRDADATDVDAARAPTRASSVIDWDASGESLAAALAATRDEGGGDDGVTESAEAAPHMPGAKTTDVGLEIAALERALVVLSTALVATCKQGAFAVAPLTGATDDLAARAAATSGATSSTAKVAGALGALPTEPDTTSRGKNVRAQIQCTTARNCKPGTGLENVWAELKAASDGQDCARALRAALKGWGAGVKTHGAALWTLAVAADRSVAALAARHADAPAALAHHRAVIWFNAAQAAKPHCSGLNIDATELFWLRVQLEADIFPDVARTGSRELVDAAAAKLSAAGAKPGTQLAAARIVALRSAAQYFEDSEACAAAEQLKLRSKCATSSSCMQSDCVHFRALSCVCTA